MSSAALAAIEREPDRKQPSWSAGAARRSRGTLAVPRARVKRFDVQGLKFGEVRTCWRRTRRRSHRTTGVRPGASLTAPSTGECGRGWARAFREGGRVVSDRCQIPALAPTRAPRHSRQLPRFVRYVGCASSRCGRAKNRHRPSEIASAHRITKRQRPTHRARLSRRLRSPSPRHLTPAVTDCLLGVQQARSWSPNGGSRRTCRSWSGWSVRPADRWFARRRRRAASRSVALCAARRTRAW